MTHQEEINKEIWETDLTENEKIEAIFNRKKEKYFHEKAKNGNEQARALALVSEEDQALKTIAMVKNGLKAINENDLQ